MHIITTLLLLILIISCSPEKMQGSQVNPSYIYNGEPALQGKYRFVARLVDNVNGPFCSAVFISPTKLVTAAHCIEYMNIGHKYIYVEASPAHDHSQNNLRFEIKSKRANSFYSAFDDRSTPTSRFDFAQIEIVGEYREGAPFPKMASTRVIKNLIPGDQVSLIGYGTKESQNENDHSRYYIDEAIGNIDSEMIIAGRPYHGAFHGDSGGAIIINKNNKNILVGIIVSNLDSRDIPGITKSIRADRIKDWIKSQDLLDRKKYWQALRVFP